MTSRLIIPLMLCMPLIGIGCKHIDSPMALSAMRPEAIGDPRWSDLGTIDTEGDVNIAMTDDYIYAQSGKVIYRKAIGETGPWKPLKAFDEDLSFIYAIPGKPDTIIVSIEEAFETLPLRSSHDGGATWKDYGIEFTENPEAVGSEYEVPRHFFRDPSGKLYASLSGANTAVSTDLGKTWTYIYGKAGIQACSSGITAVLPSYPNWIFKGQECPLDDAWIGWFDAGKADARVEKLVDSKILGNQRPNAFASTALLPNALFVGVEGGLLKYDALSRKSEWLLSASASDGASSGTLEPADTQWYGSFTNIWIDPDDARHLVISGFSKGGTIDFLVFETRDGGKSFRSMRAPTDPNALSQSKGGMSYGKKLGIPARESEGKVRVWLLDPSMKAK